MNKLLLITLLLSGCTTIVPVNKPFPEAPEELMEPPKAMLPISGTDIRLSAFLAHVIDNNSICIENAIKLNAWQSFYNKQRELFEK